MRKNIFDHVRILFMNKMSVVINYIFSERRIISGYITIFESIQLLLSTTIIYHV